MSITPRGYKGRSLFTLQMLTIDIAQAAAHDGLITGTGSEADVVGTHAVLPCDAVFIGASASAEAASDLAACGIIIYHGVAYASGTAMTAAMDLKYVAGDVKATADPVAAYVGKVLPKGSEFCLSENSTNAKLCHRLQVTMLFQSVED